MKKVKYILLLCTLPILLTGCVKFNTEMVVKKDKSMDFSIIYAIDSSLFGDEEILDEEGKNNLENHGFTVSEYSKDNMKGFTIVKNIKNIDTVSSTTDDVEYNLSGILDDKSEDNYIFKVKKGFFKNTYTAKFKFDASESDLNDTTSDYSEDFDESLYTEDSTTEDFSSDIDFSNMMTNMDLSFNVILPYSANSNNASTTNDDNKNLSWNLSSTQAETIEFEFELYNMTNIYISLGVIVLIIIIIVISVINKKKNNRNTIISNNQNINSESIQQTYNQEQNSQQTQEYSYTEKEFQQALKPQVNQNQQPINNFNQDIGISQQSPMNDNLNQQDNNNIFNNESM